MLLRETGFTFDGKHSYNNYGMQYSEKDAGHAAIPQIDRNEYQIAGRSGTVLFAGETMQPLTFAGSLYPVQEPATQMAAQALIRSVQQWLSAGRKQLIFDYEPDKYYLAQLTKQSAWSLKNWFGGELIIAFQAEPYAYAVHESAFTGSGSTPITVSAAMVTMYPAPAVIRITNTANAALTGVSINSGQIAFSGLSIAKDHWLEISFETPIGATVDGTTNALPKCTAFRPLTLAQGANTVTVALTGAGTASVEIRARGRW